MGLFKKEKIPDGIRVLYYDGGLNGFMTNKPCRIMLMEDVLCITKTKPDITVTLPRERIQSIDIYLTEAEYMLKFHGHAASTSKAKNMGIEKMYFTINYSKDNELLHLDFWCIVFEMGKVMKMRKTFLASLIPSSYSL